MDDRQFAQELDRVLGELKQKGASLAEMQTVADGMAGDYKNRKVKTVAQQPQDNRNIVQKGLGIFFDPIAKTAVRAGQAAGSLLVKGADVLSGGRLGRLTPEGNIDAALDRAINQTYTVPGLGTEVKPFEEETVKSVAGTAVGTVALGVKSVPLAGGLIGWGNALEENRGPVGQVIETVAGVVSGKVLEKGFNVVAPYMAKAIEKYGMPMFNKLSAYIPESSKATFEGIASKVSKATPDISGNILPEQVSKGISKTEEFLSGTVDRTVNKAIDITKGGYKRGVDLVKPKTPTEILATPEEKLHTLSKKDLDYFLTVEKQNAEIASKLEQQAFNKEFAGKISALTNAETKAQTIFKDTAEKLSQQITQSSRDEALRLRPKVIDAMQKQSQQYQKIVDSEINRFGNTKIDGDELALFIENKFPNNPAAVDAMKQRLGINITPAKTKPGELPIIQTKTTTKEFTAKEIYNKTKELGQEIKTPIKSGGAVFTPEQKLTDDTISTLVDFLKSKGVDLSKARQFWANYAPVRNQLVKELKPFLTPEIGTKTFADRLVRVAKGKDINNENFIKEVEGLVGEKIGVNLKKLLAKLSDNQKAMVASKASSRLKMEELKLQKKYQSEIRSMKNNTDKIAQATRRLEIEKRGLVRKIVLWAIKAVAGGSLLGWGGKYMYTRSSTE